MKPEEISVNASCLWPAGPSSPSVPLLHGCCEHHGACWHPQTLSPPLGTTPPSLSTGQEGVNATGKGLWGRKKAVPTRLRCQGERPALMRHSHHSSGLADKHPSVWETGADLFPLPCGAPWHPGPSTPPWPSACPRRARRAAGAGLTMHHQALCVLALGTLGKDGGGGPSGHGGQSASEGTVMAGAEKQRMKAGEEEKEVGHIGC